MRSTNVNSVYAITLQIVSLIFLALIVIVYVLYISGALPTPRSPRVIADTWHLNAQAFQEKNQIPRGWAWVRYLGQGDIISLGTIFLMSLTSIICLPAALAIYIKERNTIYTAIVAVEFLVLCLAALGVLPPG